MKNIKIITLYGNENFGNKLQNFALQEYLKRLNFDVQTISNVYMPYGKEKLNLIYNGSRFGKKILRNFTISKIDKLRIKKITNFSNSYLNVIDNNWFNINKIKKSTDYFIYGSDQIWNPNSCKNFNIRLGLFADKEQNIAYAPSFSVERIDDTNKELYNKALNNISKLSTREQKGKEIIENVSKLDSKVVLDPVFLLNKEEWENQGVTKSKVEKKYIFTYFLGNLENNKKEQIKNFAKNNNYEIIDILDKNNENTYISDPIDFLNYIYNAELILTDSFHAVAFSIIFNKNFYVSTRVGGEGMLSRINNILSITGLEDRLIKEFDDVVLNDFTINEYNNVNTILLEEIEKSKEYLNSCF